MMFFTLIVAALASAPDHSPRSDPILVFMFPDGARGGVGKVKGLSTPEPGRIKPEDTKILLNTCGLRDTKSFNQVSHRFYFYGRSTSSDVKVVRCFQRLTYTHFTVGVGRTNSQFGGMPEILDEVRFRRFWRDTIGSKSK